MRQNGVLSVIVLTAATDKHLKNKKEVFVMFGLPWLHNVLLILSAFIIGFAKTGLTGATLPAIAMMAYTFGAKASSGIMLTMLIMGDLMAIYNYRRDGKFKDVMKVLPPAIVGIALGAVIGNYLDDGQFKFLLGIIVIICLVLIVFKELTNKSFEVSQNRLFHIAVGIASGFSSMVGNAAGPLFSIYMLSMSYQKNKFIGTTAWFFFAVNLIKVPFHVFLWGTITFDTIKYTLVMIPVIFLGALLGVNVVKKIKEKHFKIIVIIMTVIAAIRLMV
jgi:uncharacterized membrane protein YfcA